MREARASDQGDSGERRRYPRPPRRRPQIHPHHHAFCSPDTTLPSHPGPKPLDLLDLPPLPKLDFRRCLQVLRKHAELERCSREADPKIASPPSSEEARQEWPTPTEAKDGPAGERRRSAAVDRKEASSQAPTEESRRLWARFTRSEEEASDAATGKSTVNGRRPATRTVRFAPHPFRFSSLLFDPDGPPYLGLDSNINGPSNLTKKPTKSALKLQPRAPPSRHESQSTDGVYKREEQGTFKKDDGTEQPVLSSSSIQPSESEEGWQLVLKKRGNRHRRHHQEVSPAPEATVARSRPKAPSFLRGRCYRCLASDHKRSSCRDPVRCWTCGRLQHTARRCNRLAMSSRRPRLDDSFTLEGPARGGSRRPPSPDRRRRSSEERPAIDHSRRPRQAWIAMEANVQTQQRQAFLTSRALMVADKSRRKFVSSSELREYIGAALGSNRFSVHFDYPADFMVICDSDHMRDDLLAVKEIAIGDRRIQFFPWTAERFGSKTHWDFSVRLALEGMPHQAWNVESVQRLLAPWCIVQHIDSASLNHIDLSCLRLWARAKDPNKIPTMCYFSLMEPAVPGQLEVQSDFIRPTEWKNGLEYCVLIHLEKIEDLTFYHPLPVIEMGRRDESRARVREHRWHRGFEDWEIEPKPPVKEAEHRERSRTPRRSLHRDKQPGNEGWSRYSLQKHCREGGPAHGRNWDDEDDDLDRNREFRSGDRNRGRHFYQAQANKGKEPMSRGRSPIRHGYQYRGRAGDRMGPQSDWLDRGERRALELLWADKGTNSAQEKNLAGNATAPPHTNNETQPKMSTDMKGMDTQRAPSASSGNSGLPPELMHLPDDSQAKLKEALSTVLQGAAERMIAQLLNDGLKKIASKGDTLVIPEQESNKDLGNKEQQGNNLEGKGKGDQGQKEPAPLQITGEAPAIEAEASASNLPVVSIPNTAEIGMEGNIEPGQKEDSKSLQFPNDQCTPTSTCKIKSATDDGKMAKEQIAKKWNLEPQGQEDVLAKQFKSPLTQAHIEEAQNLISEHLPKKNRRANKAN